MVIHACVLSQALFSTELHWRTKIVRFGDHVGALVLQLADLRRLSRGHTWLYSALTRYDSSSALFDATPACPHTLSGPVLHTYVSDSSTQSPDALFSIVLKPPAGVFSTTDRLPPATAGYRPATVGYRPATVGYRPAIVGYRRLPPSTDRLPPSTDRLPPATDRLPPVAGYRPATSDYRRLPPATNRLQTGYRRLPTTDRLPPATVGYRRLPTGYRPATAGYRPATDRLPPTTADYRRLPPATNRLQTGYRRLKKKKKKKFLFDAWGMPLVLSTNRVPDLATGRCRSCPKNFRDTCYKMRTVCVSLYIYIWTLNT